MLRWFLSSPPSIQLRRLLVSNQEWLSKSTIKYLCGQRHRQTNLAIGSIYYHQRQTDRTSTKNNSHSVAVWDRVYFHFVTDKSSFRSSAAGLQCDFGVIVVSNRKMSLLYLCPSEIPLGVCPSHWTPCYIIPWLMCIDCLTPSGSMSCASIRYWLITIGRDGKLGRWPVMSSVWEDQELIKLHCHFE